RARARLLRIHARTGEAPDAGLEQPPVVIDQGHGFETVGLIRLDRHPVPGFGREQSEPIVELALVEKPRLAQQKLFAALEVERLPCGQAGDAAGADNMPAW